MRDLALTHSGIFTSCVATYMAYKKSCPVYNVSVLGLAGFISGYAHVQMRRQRQRQYGVKIDPYFSKPEDIRMDQYGDAFAGHCWRTNHGTYVNGGIEVDSESSISLGQIITRVVRSASHSGMTFLAPQWGRAAAAERQVPFVARIVNASGTGCGACDRRNCTGCLLPKGNARLRLRAGLFTGAAGTAKIYLALDWMESSRYDQAYVESMKEEQSAEAAGEETDTDTVPLASCINAFVAAEEMKAEGDNGVKCDQCKSNIAVDAQKKIDIWREPDVLVLHIKRFHFSGDHFEKISTPVQGAECPGRHQLPLFYDLPPQVPYKIHCCASDMHIVVEPNVGKKKFNLKVEASDSIKDVKAKIQEQEKLTPDKYSLSFDMKELKDGQVLSDTKIWNNTKISLVMHPTGLTGPNPPPCGVPPPCS
ncbi:USP6 [Symbiodinium natans]|uniref:USP6 protein n=1 Tax=Symbiodinium natans TaxID=878477 RepID=A0A812MYZ5_9DINO|nr:USP6 [Symbiodinium natans]